MSDIFPFLILRLSLAHIQPEIWRSIAVESDLELDHLHFVIQELFQWDNRHLHEFEFEGKRYAPSSEEDPFDDFDDSEDESTVSIGDLLQEVGESLSYQYDFGDGWEIKIELTRKESLPYDRSAVCLAGERAAPPEDCGGVPGYKDLVSAVQSPTTQHHRDLLSWLNRPWDPESFDINSANRSMAAVFEELKDEVFNTILEPYAEWVTEAIEKNKPALVGKTFRRLLSLGMSAEEVMESVVVATLRSTELSNNPDPNQVDQKILSKVFNQLPEMPWLNS